MMSHFKTSAQFELVEVPTEQTFDLRHRILRPHQTIAEMSYPQDQDPERRHFAVKSADHVISIASFYPEPLLGQNWRNPWRLRGMAVDNNYQGQGLGQRLLLHALAVLNREGITEVWCHARLSALPFYLKLGFATLGETFAIEPIGLHQIAYLRLDTLTKEE